MAQWSNIFQPFSFFISSPNLNRFHQIQLKVVPGLFSVPPLLVISITFYTKWCEVEWGKGQNASRLLSMSVTWARLLSSGHDTHTMAEARRPSRLLPSLLGAWYPHYGRGTKAIEAPASSPQGIIHILRQGLKAMGLPPPLLSAWFPHSGKGTKAIGAPASTP